jgi:hypothetical protein
MGPGDVQVIAWPPSEQFQFVPTADTNVNPAGNVSLTVIVPVVAIVPRFATEIV